MTALQTHAEQVRNGGATAKSITLPSSPSLVVGDDMYLQFAGGADLSGTDHYPTGWSIVEEEKVSDGNVSVHHVVLHRTCQSGDPGSVVTVVDTVAAIAKSVLQFVAVRSVDSTAPINKSGKTFSTSGTTHGTPALSSVTTTGKVLEFLAMKDGTASSTLTIDALYDVIARTSTGGTTAPIVAGSAISHADIASGTVASKLWTSDQASTNVSTIGIAVAPSSTVVGVRTSSDITLPSSATFTGGTTLFGVHGDDDPNTYDRFIVSAVAQVEEEKFPALPGPLTGYTGKVVLDGAASVDVVVKLVRGSTVIYTGSTHTISAAGEQSYHDDFDGTVQTAQAVDLTDIRVRKSFLLTP